MLIADVFAQVFEEPARSFTDESSRDTVAGWTSLRHVGLMVQIENAFGIKFTNPELAAIRSMGDIRTALRRRGVEES